MKAQFYLVKAFFRSEDFSNPEVEKQFKIYSRDLLSTHSQVLSFELKTYNVQT